MRIGVAGISGRMGQLVAGMVASQGATLVGGIAGRTQPSPNANLFDSLAALADACDVVIDFTHADTVRAHAATLGEAGTAWILGTTGLTKADQNAVAVAARSCAVVQAANFSPGLSLVLTLARRLAAALPPDEYDAEIVEMHHRAKRDAPSGTALAIGDAVAAGRGGRLDDLAQPARRGQTGVRIPGGIGLASLRGGSVIGDHTLLFASDSEHIALIHSARDRAVFARGALRAALWTRSRPSGLYGMEDVLGLTNIEGRNAECTSPATTPRRSPRKSCLR